MSGQCVWKIIKDLGKRVGVDTIHPHAFRHACGVTQRDQWASLGRGLD